MLQVAWKRQKNILLINGVNLWFADIFSLGSDTTLWMMFLSEITNKINIEIADPGIIGATYTVVKSVASTITEILYGKKKNTDDKN